uniref:Putative nucleoprotein n=1 Tax=Soybean thrips negative-stranded RNA virus 2 TaxID=2796548 RepID=A0A7T3R0R3_9VIRU|nr:putative nucleoprotein [Soybean thrips negative-stranded RNA virus 2]
MIFDLSDSESDESDMGDSENSALSSRIHKLCLEYCEDNTLPDSYYERNLRDFTALFNNRAALWNAYRQEADNYVPTAPLPARIQQAIAIARAAVELRGVIPETILTTMASSVTVNEINPQDSADLLELCNFVKAKMTKTGQQGTEVAGNSEKMFKEYQREIRQAAVTGVISDTWFTKNRIWKMKQFAEMSGKEFPQLASRAPEGMTVNNWNQLKKKIKDAEGSAPPNHEERSEATQYANKFAVDSWCCVVNLFKKARPECTANEATTLLRKVAYFTLSERIGSKKWIQFLENLPAPESTMLRNLDALTSIFDNPAKCNKSRLFSCAATLYPGVDPTRVFAKAVGTVELSLMASIYRLEKDAGAILPDPARTSTSEHLMHLLLVLGQAHDYSKNRNALNKSAITVEFVVV